MTTMTLSVPGISCGHCAAAITAEVGALDDVSSVDVSVDEKTVTVDGSAGRDAIVAAIAEAGYEVVEG